MPKARLRSEMRATFSFSICSISFFLYFSGFLNSFIVPLLVVSLKQPLLIVVFLSFLRSEGSAGSRSPNCCRSMQSIRCPVKLQ